LKIGHIDPQEAEHDARTLLSWQHERRKELIVRKFYSQLVTLLYSVASPLVLLTTVNNNKQRKTKLPAFHLSFMDKKGKYYATLGRQTRDATIGDIRRFTAAVPDTNAGTNRPPGSISEQQSMHRSSASPRLSHPASGKMMDIKWGK
jgi:hypothetical protein